MSTTITRLFKTEKQALDAVGALKKPGGFREGEINMVAGGADGALAAIMKGGVPASHAKVYAEHVGRGASLVTVVAPSLTSQRATKILRSFDPMPSPVAEPDIYTRADVGGMPKIWHAEPNTEVKLLKSDSYFSRLFGMPLIIKDAKPMAKVSTESKPAPNFPKGTLSSWLGLPTISRG